MSRLDSPWSHDEDRCYHGVRTPSVVRVFVELPDYSDRKPEPTVLRELHPDYMNASFEWGYIGAGTNATAKAVLADAMGEDPGMRMLLDFGEDMLSQFPAEFRIRRGAVLRWARGWVAQRDRPVPPVLAELPPVSRAEYRPRPRQASAESREVS